MKKHFGKIILMLVLCLALCNLRTMNVCAAETATSVTSEYISSYDEAVNFVRQSLLDRVTSITVKISSDLFNQYQQIWEDACGYHENGAGYEGDALYWDLGSWYVQRRSGSSGYQLTYTIEYHTSATQEKELRAAVTKTLAGLNISGKSEYEKAKAIYEYICTNVSYDYEGLEAGDAGIYSAYSALIKGKAVCQGYATLFYRMAKEAGLSARIVAGYSYSGERHAWNIVKIGDLYYICDSTWGSDMAAAQPLYFLQGELEYNQTFCDPEFDEPEFTSAYPISYYKYGQTFDKLNLDNPTATITDRNGKTQTSAANGKPKLVIVFGYKCGNSRAFLQSLTGLLEEGYNVEVLAGNCQSGTDADVEAFLTENKIHSDIAVEVGGNYQLCLTYKSWMNNNGYGSVSILPFVFYIDANNKIQYFCNGYQDVRQIATYLEVYCGATKGTQKELTISKNPTDIKATAGDQVTFSVGADGDGITYQWQFKLSESGAWTNSKVSAAKTANMTFTATDTSLNGRQYRCVVQDSYGNTLTSNAATLTVVPKFAITSQPSNITAKAGDTVTFSVKATGEGLTYEWQYKNAGASTWSTSKVSAAKTANMKFTVGTDKTLNGRQYRCIVRDKNNNSKTSNVATLTVNAGITITSQPVNAVAAMGEKVTFSVKATGTNLTYQWQYKNAGASTWSNSGAAAAKTANMTFTLNTDKNLNGRQYRCVMKDANGNLATSNAVTLSALIITKQPGNVTASAGTKVTFSIQAVGSGLTYQWQYKNANSTTWSNSGIAAAKTANMTFTVGTDKNLNGRQYRCVVTDKNGKKITSNVGVLTVK